MTKEVFAGFFKKAIPVVGGVIGGGITGLATAGLLAGWLLAAVDDDAAAASPHRRDPVAAP